MSDLTEIHDYLNELRGYIKELIPVISNLNDRIGALENVVSLQSKVPLNAICGTCKSTLYRCNDGMLDIYCPECLTRAIKNRYK